MPPCGERQNYTHLLFLWSSSERMLLRDDTEEVADETYVGVRLMFTPFSSHCSSLVPGWK